jgi:hypothetical protein
MQGRRVAFILYCHIGPVLKQLPHNFSLLFEQPCIRLRAITVVLSIYISPVLSGSMASSCGTHLRGRHMQWRLVAPIHDCDVCTVIQ